MLGALFLEEEVSEIIYLVKKELEELSDEMNEQDINHIVLRAMEERYKLLYKIFRRFAPKEECMRFLRPMHTKKINE